jgi:hypothetical protein
MTTDTTLTAATPADTKPQPKVTFEKALAVMQPQMEQLLTETIAKFELDPADKKSRKRIFAAIVAASAEFMANKQNISTSSLGRRAAKAVYSLKPQNFSIDTGSVADESDDNGDE